MNVKLPNILLCALLLSGCSSMRKADSSEVSKNAPVFIRPPATNVVQEKRAEFPKITSFNLEPLVIMREADLNALVEKAKTNAPSVNNEKVSDILLNKPEPIRPVVVTSDLQVQTVGVSPFLQEQTVGESKRSTFAVLIWSYLAVATILFGFLTLVKKLFFSKGATPATFK